MTIRYGSVCSGVESATLAWKNLGWQAQWFSEVELFPSEVLAYHYPDVPNLGDMTVIEQRPEFNDTTIDLLVGGTPCQSFSVAGLRKGLDDERGNLCFKFCDILRRKKPRWFVWENVPGVFTSASDARSGDDDREEEAQFNSDFACFLTALQECGYSCAWRIFDAKHFGVPQRRRRIFVVGYLGDWRPPAAVLFERESLQRDFTPSKSEGQNSTAFTKTSFGSYDQGCGTLRAAGGDLGGGSETLVAQSLITETGGTLTTGFGDRGLSHEQIWNGNCAICFTQNDAARDATKDLAPTLRAGSNGGAVHPAVAYAVHGTQDPCVDERTAFCLRHNNGAENVVCYSIQGNIIDRGVNSGGNGSGFSKDICGTLTTADRHAVMTAKCLTTSNQRIDAETETFIPCITSGLKLAVRRLTPLECERLMGFTDNYTKIPYRNKQVKSCPDGPRYKACGNSMVSDVMLYIGTRIQLVDELIR